MAVNTAPIFVGNGDLQWITGITAANTNADITAGTSYLVYTAPASGGLVRGIFFKANPANNTAATVVRVWLNNGSTTGTASNSCIVMEYAVAATTASATAAQPNHYIVFPGGGLVLASGYKLYLTLGTAPGGSGAFSAAADAGSYVAQ